MKTLENEVLVETPTDTERSPPMKTGGYDAVRFNAVKHGVLGRCTMLFHVVWIGLPLRGLPDNKVAEANVARLMENDRVREAVDSKGCKQISRANRSWLPGDCWDEFCQTIRRFGLASRGCALTAGHQCASASRGVVLW